ncbi:hypothetical protein [Kordia zhangzhouensis]|uniref:hypothetical protein n=1 Tax=Kordia zhangzhouensis TaxID=1620405 RepID=UPI0012E08335|nr:hypothetical protein [Kordia zhangzhouensis]
MKKSTLPIILIVASIILIVVNSITTEAFDRGFWMRILSSVLLIVAMVLTIRSERRSSK